MEITCIKKLVQELEKLDLKLYVTQNKVVTEERIENDKHRFFKIGIMKWIQYCWKNNILSKD